MTATLLAAAFPPERIGPTPAGIEGLVASVVLIAFLALQQLRPVQGPGQTVEREANRLRWAVHVALIGAVAVIVVERVVVLT